jgi:putative flippase GtrA
VIIDPVFLEKIFKFVVVGSTAFILDFGSTYLFKEKVKVNKYVANTLAFVIAATYNFVLNRWWTWGIQDDQVAMQAFKFAGVMTTGLLITSGLIYIFSDRMKFNFYIAKLIGVSVAMVWNFTMNNFVTFGH